MLSISLYYNAFCIRRKIHILYLPKNIRDFLLIKKNCLGILFYKRIIYILFLWIVYLCRHSLLKINNFFRGDNLLFQTIATGHKIDHVCHHKCLNLGLIRVILVEIKIFFWIRYIEILFLIRLSLFLCLVSVSTIFYYKDIITFLILKFFGGFHRY